MTYVRTDFWVNYEPEGEEKRCFPDSEEVGLG